MVGSVYAPAQPTPRLAFLQNMRKWVSAALLTGHLARSVCDLPIVTGFQYTKKALAASVLMADSW